MLSAVNGKSCSPLNSRVQSHACFIFCNNFRAREKDIRGCTRLRDMHGRGSRWVTNEKFSAIYAISCRYLELGWGRGSNKMTGICRPSTKKVPV